MKKVLILGGSGFIGWHLFQTLGRKRALATHHRKEVPGTVFFDAMAMSIDEIIDDPTAYDYAVILLGYTNPDACASDPEGSHTINVEKVSDIVDRLREIEIVPVFTSSESVFDGTKGQYLETDAPAPILRYGTQKLAVEKHIQDTCEDFLILRLARVYGTDRGDGTLFSNILGALENNRDLAIAVDNVFSPIHVEDAVNIMIRLMEGGHRGVYHVAGPEALTRHRMLETLLTHYRAQGGDFTGTIQKCHLADISTPEPRPLDISMIPDKAIAATGLKPTPVADRLDALTVGEKSLD